MEDKKIKIYPSLEAVTMVDYLDDGYLKDKDEFIDKFYHFQCSQNADIATHFDNFLMGYTHWTIEITKENLRIKIKDWMKETVQNYHILTDPDWIDNAMNDLKNYLSE